jgi:hypothetical protein
MSTQIENGGSPRLTTPPARSVDGHEERFPPPRLSGRYGFSKETVARVPGSGRDAPED